MGNQITVDNGNDATKTNGTDYRSRIGNDRNPDTTDKRTGTDIRGTDIRGTDIRGTDIRETKTEKENVLGIPIVEEKKPKTREEINAERRKKYAEEKAKNGGNVKPRKTKKTETNTSIVNTAQTEMLIKSISAMIASRPQMECWLLTDDEVKAITTPLNNILSNSESLKGLNEHADSVALVIACLTIFLPRIMITLSIKGVKKRERKPITNNSNDINGRKDTAVENSNTSVHGQNTESVQLHDKNVLDVLPVTA